MTLPRLLAPAAAALLAGCASLGGDADAPICDGRDRRPANPHGSTLVAAPTPAVHPAPPAASPGGGCA